MTRDELFDEIQALQAVDIDHALERGRDYLLERLMDCRRRQDRMGQISVIVKRATFNAKIARRHASAQVKLMNLDPVGRAKDLTDHLQTENEYDQWKALEEACGVARSTLKAADSDIRLAANLLGIQIGLGNPGSPPSSDTAAPDVPGHRPAASSEPRSTVEQGLEDFFGAAAAPVTYTTKPDTATVSVPEVELINLSDLLT